LHEQAKQKDSRANTKVITIDHQAIATRLRHLDSSVLHSPYERKKECMQAELVAFLQHSSSNTLTSATPEDIRSFLAWKDNVGKTKVHDTSCPRLGQGSKTDCQCPTRLAYGTVKTNVAMLKSIFDSIDYMAEYGTPHTLGNPTLSIPVRRYVKAISTEQSQAHVTPQQAKPLFLDKLKKIIGFIEREYDRIISAREQFSLVRDQAFLKLQFFGGDKAGDLGHLLTQEIFKVPGGVIFECSKGKTFDTCNTNQFAIATVSDSLLCPVAGLNRYWD
jgi:hypothetical protein